MSLTPKQVAVFVPLFSPLRFDRSAIRSTHLQAGGFVWSDETPDLHPDGDFPVPVTRFMIALISYRETLMRGHPHEPFTPFWDQFQRSCPTWPGFRPERCDSSLIEELDRELDAEWEQLERLLAICELRKRRGKS